MTTAANATPAALSAPDATAVRRRLNWVAIVALIDFVLLIPLAVGLATGHHGLAPVLGPIHGIGFIVELFLAARGALDRYWGWWLPGIVLISGGPLGALIGHRVVSSRL